MMTEHGDATLPVEVVDNTSSDYHDKNQHYYNNSSYGSC